jgi:excisionase family DNA binding protein
MPNEKLLFRVNEAADALSLSRSKVYQLINEGKIPAVHIGGVLRVHVGALQALIDEQADFKRDEGVYRDEQPPA